MKPFMLAFVVCIIFAMSTFSQSKKTIELMQEGIKSKDFVKIEDALSKGISPKDGLLLSIDYGNVEVVKYFIEKGAMPTSGINYAVRKNKIDIVKFLLDKGAIFENEVDKDVVSPACFLPSVKNLIPPVYKNNKWMKKDEYTNKYVSVKDLVAKGYQFSFRLEEIVAGNPSLIYAIENNNPEMVDLLIKHGINATKPCITKHCYSWILPLHFSGTTTVYPIPAIIQRPIEYAIAKNAKNDVVEILQKYDSTINYKFNIEKMVYSYDNSCDSILSVKTNDFGISISKKKKNDDVYGVIYYSADNSSFKEINLFSRYGDIVGDFTDFTEYKSRYFFNEFGANYKPKEIILKIGLRHYQKFDDINNGSFIDKRDGQTYKMVKIGNQMWMAQNLNYEMFYDDNNTRNNDSMQCRTYGRLYTYKMAEDACPPGWHLPSALEWNQLINHLGGAKIAPDKMKERGTAHWEINKSGTNSSGFTALPAGFCFDNLRFDANGVYGAWLAAENDQLAFLLSGYIRVQKAYSGRYYSIRCLKDQ